MSFITKRIGVATLFWGTEEALTSTNKWKANKNIIWRYCKRKVILKPIGSKRRIENKNITPTWLILIQPRSLWTLMQIMLLLPMSPSMRRMIWIMSFDLFYVCGSFSIDMHKIIK